MSDTRPQNPTNDNHPSKHEQPIGTVNGSILNYIVVSITFLIVGVLIGTTLGTNTTSIDQASIERAVRSALADVDLGAAQPDRFELVADSPYLGAEDAPIVIVEFSDFRCPYCGRHYQATLQPLLETYGEHIRYVYRHFAALGPESVTASLASECANEQGRFWEFHDKFFTHQDQLGRDFYLATAQEFDLDLDQFTACLDEQRYMTTVSNDGIDGQLNGINGTPGFFINGNFIRGAQPYEVFERVILRELQKAGINTESS